MRKNILIFGHHYGPPFSDVTNQYTALFDKNQYEVTAAYLFDKPDEEIRRQHLADNVVFLNLSKKSIRGLKINAIKKILELHKEKNFDIVICHRYKPLHVMLWVSLFKKVPVLISVMHEFNTLKRLSRRLTIACLARKETILFAGVSDAVRDNIRRDIWKIPSDRVITLYNAIDVKSVEDAFFEKEEARKKLNLPADAFLFGNIGRLVVNKDQKTLINAFSLVKEKYPEAKLAIIGIGGNPIEIDLKKQVQELGLTEDVFFVGFIPQGHRFIKAFDVFVLSSIQEAFGRVLLEAMIAKIPIIATRVNGIPEVIGDTGILIDPAKPKEMSEAMIKSLELLRAGSEIAINKAYDRVTREFSTERFHETFWQLPLVKQ